MERDRAGRIKFTLTKEQVEDAGQAHAEFHHVYGCTMANWAAIERALYYWFACITQMDEGMAISVFYSARSFNARADMLLAAIRNAKRQTEVEIQFVKAALKKARSYSAFRNMITHGEPILSIIDREGAPREIAYHIVEYKNPEARVSVTMEDLMVAADNYQLLKVAIIDALPNQGRGTTPEQCLEQVRALPNQADSRTSPNPSESE